MRDARALPERRAVRFTLDDAQAAAEAWGMNCGPGAIAGVLGMTLDEVRPHLGDFERKRYTNPTLMWAALNSIGADWRLDRGKPPMWPSYGLVRVQWEGPWTAPGVPIAARYRHTHWVGAAVTETESKVFDINCICAGGWVPFSEWDRQVVPWLLQETTPRANGRYHITHSVEIAARALPLARIAAVGANAW